MAKEKSKSRQRTFATVVYPESAPENWLTILDEQHIATFVSPLHDQDLNPDGEPKKTHRHVMIMFDSVKTVEQAREVFDLIGGVGCEQVKTTRGYARYLCHLDNPEKCQYKEDDVICMNGADYPAVIGLSIDKYKAVKEIIAYCKEKDEDCYADLLEYSAMYRMDWFRVLCDNGTIVVKEYLKSRAWKKTTGRTSSS